MRVRAPLKRFVDPGRPITYGIVQAGPDWPGGVPYVRPIDMTGHEGVPEVSRLLRTSPEIARGYERAAIKPGDIVISIGPSFGKTMLVPAALDGANLTQGTARVAPVQGSDGRYIRWCLQNSEAITHWEAAVGGATFRALNLEPLSLTPIPVCELGAQRAIADYLDAETARIDALIAKKRRMIELLEERWTIYLDQWVTTAAEAGRVPLKHVAETVTVGIVVTPSQWYANEGVIALRGLNVRPLRVLLNDLVYLTAEGHELHAKSELQAGDCVTVRTGQAGATAVVPPELDGCNCIDLLITRPRSPLMDSHFLCFVLNSNRIRQEVDQHSVGALQAHFNVGSLREVAVPLPPLTVQRQMAEEASRVRLILDQLSATLARQLDLLAERRQALITAAVTGEMAVPGVEA